MGEQRRAVLSAKKAVRAVAGELRYCTTLVRSIQLA
jgi:hypothetical protein